MATQIPDFDFSQYNPQDEWNFPGQRLVRYAAEAYHIVLEPRNFWLKRHPHPDFRTVFWAELCGQAHAMLVLAMQLRSHGNDLSWWEVQPEFSHTFDKRLIASNNMTIRQLMQLGFVQHVVRQIDLLLRKLLNTLTENPIKTKFPLGSVFLSLLGLTESKGEASLLTLWQIYRDSLSQEGRFCPVNGNDLQLTFGGRQFSFPAQRRIEWDSLGFLDHWEFSLYLLRELAKQINRLFESKLVAEIPFLKAPFLEP
jgi:hypothetical protein